MKGPRVFLAIMAVWMIPLGLMALGSRSPAQRCPDGTLPVDTTSIITSPRGTNIAASLTPDQRRVAGTIIRVGRELQVSPRGWVVALATAMQESQLGAYPPSQTPNRDGDVGVFQQRSYVGWYANGNSQAENIALLNNPEISARIFFVGNTVAAEKVAIATHPAGPAGYHIPGLLDIPGWEQMPITVAAQKVQVSAFPDAYAKWEATALALVQDPEVSGSASTSVCQTNPTRAGGVSGNTLGERAISAASQWVGTPYSWAGGDSKGPTKGICCSPGGQDARNITGFDCSGLVLYAFAQAGGPKLPHFAQTMVRSSGGRPIPRDLNQMQPGDVIGFAKTPGGYIFHVGIYMGDGKMINSDSKGVNVASVTNGYYHRMAWEVVRFE